MCPKDRNQMANCRLRSVWFGWVYTIWPQLHVIITVFHILSCFIDAPFSFKETLLKTSLFLAQMFLFEKPALACCDIGLVSNFSSVCLLPIYLFVHPATLTLVSIPDCPRIWDYSQTTCIRSTVFIFYITVLQDEGKFVTLTLVHATPPSAELFLSLHFYIMTNVATSVAIELCLLHPILL